MCKMPGTISIPVEVPVDNTVVEPSPTETNVPSPLTTPQVILARNFNDSKRYSSDYQESLSIGARMPSVRKLPGTVRPTSSRRRVHPTQDIPTRQCAGSAPESRAFDPTPPRS